MLNATFSVIFKHCAYVRISFISFKYRREFFKVDISKEWLHIWSFLFWYSDIYLLWCSQVAFEDWGGIWSEDALQPNIIMRLLKKLSGECIYVSKEETNFRNWVHTSTPPQATNMQDPESIFQNTVLGNSPALHWQQKILISTKGRRIQTLILSKWLFVSYKCNVIRWIYPTYPIILGYLDCYRCHQESFTHFTYHAYVFNSNIDSVYVHLSILLAPLLSI